MKNRLLIVIVCFNSILLVAQNRLNTQIKFPDSNSEIENDFLSHPFDVQIFQDNYFVLDVVEAKIKIYSKNGQYLRSIGKKGKGPGELFDPFAFTINRDNGDIYISDQGNGRICKFANSGKYLDSFRFISEPIGILFAKNMIFALVIDNKKGFKINCYTHNGELLNEFGGESDSKLLGNKIPSSILFGMGGIKLADNSLIIFFNYLPYLYVYNLQGKFEKKIIVDVGKFNQILESNLNPVRKGARLSMRFIHLGVAYEERNFYMFERENNILYKVSDTGLILEKIKINSTPKDSRIFTMKENSKFVFINSTEGIVEVFK